MNLRKYRDPDHTITSRSVKRYNQGNGKSFSYQFPYEKIILTLFFRGISLKIIECLEILLSLFTISFLFIYPRKLLEIIKMELVIGYFTHTRLFKGDKLDKKVNISFQEAYLFVCHTKSCFACLCLMRNRIKHIFYT